MRRDQLLLVQTGAAALDAIEVLVDLVGAVEGNLHERVRWKRVEGDGGEAVVQDVLPRLVARGDEADGGGVDAEGGDGLDDVDDRGPGADADVFGGGVEVVVHRADGGVAFRGLDVHGREGALGEYEGGEDGSGE